MNSIIFDVKKQNLLNLNHIKSPLNYTGGKFKLLGQLRDYFPSDTNTFIDLFAGGCNVAVNANADKIIANDINPHIIELYNHLKENDADYIFSEIDELINRYGLSNSYLNGYEYYNSTSKDGLSIFNKEKYLKLRADYNKNPNPIMFFTLVIYAFNNQIRFNQKGEFNLPVNKRDFTSNMRTNLKLFVNRIQKLNIDFISKDFSEVDVPDDAFVYIDPPYLATTASYNENGGWSEKHEIRLLEYLDELHSKNIKFALSNVFESKGVKNDILIDWCLLKGYKINYLNYSYANCSYQTKNRDKDSTVEVLITNYDKFAINGLTSFKYHLEPQLSLFARSL